jgi:hypothetical protein
MGWLYQYDPVDDPVDHLTRKFICEDDQRTLPPLDGARVGNTVYFAVRTTIKESGHSYVFAVVILISNTAKDGFGYKDMDETAGPCQCDCPDRIMRLLSPIDELPRAGYAADWRARVAERKTQQRQQREKRKTLRIGSVLTLPRDLQFPGGVTAKTFRLHHFRRRTPIFEPVDRPGFYCRLRGGTIAAAQITEPASPEFLVSL